MLSWPKRIASGPRSSFDIRHEVLDLHNYYKQAGFTEGQVAYCTSQPLALPLCFATFERRNGLKLKCIVLCQNAPHCSGASSSYFVGKRS